MLDLPTKDCRCGRKITFAVNPETGKQVPIDQTLPIYRLELDHATQRVNAVLLPKNEHGVNHYKTCAQAEGFSKAAKARRLKVRKLLQRAVESINNRKGLPAIKAINEALAVIGK